MKNHWVSNCKNLRQTRFKRNKSTTYPRDISYVQARINFWSDTRGWTDLPNVWGREVFNCQFVDDTREGDDNASNSN